MAWRYNPKHLRFEEDLMPPPPPPEVAEGSPAGVNPFIFPESEVATGGPAQGGQNSNLYSPFGSGGTSQPTAFGGPGQYTTLRDRNTAPQAPQSPQSPQAPQAPRPQQPQQPQRNESAPGRQPTSGGGRSGSGGGREGGGRESREDKPSAIPDLSKIPAPDGYAYSINPLTQQLEFIDLSPLDQSQPLSGWHWIVDDPNDASSGHWTFTPSPTAMEDPYEGIPTPVIGWVQQALDAGGDTNVVPEGPAREWVKFILTQATNPGVQAPGEVPFGMGLPKFDRTGSGMPTAPTDSTPGVGGGDNWVKTLLQQLFTGESFEGRYGRPEQGGWFDQFNRGGGGRDGGGGRQPRPGVPEPPVNEGEQLAEYLRQHGVDDATIAQVLTLFA